HPIELAGLLLEAANEQHVAERGQLLLFGEFGHRARYVVACSALGGRWNGRFVGGYRHMAPQEKGRLTSVIGPTPISRNRVRAKAQGGTAVGGGSERFPAGFRQPESALTAA